MTPEERKRQSLIKWLHEHAPTIPCPPCAGKRHPDRQADCRAQGPNICPVCHKVWMYRVRIEIPVARRVPVWWYSNNQPFIKERHEQG